MGGWLGGMAAVPFTVDDDESAEEGLTAAWVDCAISAEEATTKRNERQETGSFTVGLQKVKNPQPFGSDRSPAEMDAGQVRGATSCQNGERWDLKSNLPIDGYFRKRHRLLM